MKPFRFAWNGEIFSKRDTQIVLGTIVMALLFLLATIYCLVFET